MREATFDDPLDAVANHTKLILGREATDPKEWVCVRAPTP